MLITILGPDGTGKTTLAKGLAKDTKGLEYFYFGGSNESREYQFFENFIKSDLKNIFLRVIRKFLRVINDLYVYQIAKKSNFISDRCPIDNYIITKVQGRRIRFYYYFSLMLSPNLDCVILLTCDSEVIHKRKEELSVDEINNYIKFYKKYLDAKGINYMIVNTVENDIDKTLKIAKNKLEFQLNER